MFVIVAFSKVAGADFSFSHSGSVKKEAQKLPRVFLKHRKVTYSSWACSSHRRLQAKWIWQLFPSIAWKKTWPSLHLRVWFAPTRSFAFFPKAFGHGTQQWLLLGSCSCLGFQRLGTDSGWRLGYPRSLFTLPRKSSENPRKHQQLGAEILETQHVPLLLGMYPSLIVRSWNSSSKSRQSLKKKVQTL